MSGFTTATITHSFTNADGSAGSGAVTFLLSKRMTQPGRTIIPGEIASTLNASGDLSQSLTANNDPGTFPGDSEWLVTFRLVGDSPDGPYAITVPTGGGTIDLATLLPQIGVGGG